MSHDTYLSDNAGHRACPGAVCADPVLASGQTLVAGSKNIDDTCTVVAGARYALTSVVGWHGFGIATCETAANIIWAAAEGETIVIHVPTGYTTLHYITGSNSRKVYLRRLN